MFINVFLPLLRPLLNLNEVVTAVNSGVKRKLEEWCLMPNGKAGIVTSAKVVVDLTIRVKQLLSLDQIIVLSSLLTHGV